MTIYMKVSKDKYELPVAVASSAQELARMCNTTANAIRSAINHTKSRGGNSVYVRVTVEDEEVVSDDRRGADQGSS